MTVKDLKKLLENQDDETLVHITQPNDYVFRLSHLVECSNYLAHVGPLKKNGDVKYDKDVFNKLLVITISNCSDEQVAAYTFFTNKVQSE